ncbi:MAG: hypothetical protein KAQ91_03930 [Methylococcales bacterium]|nr:hypothetical protein [Methylococcales bacterium]
MKTTAFLSILLLLISTNQAFAYGSSSSKKSCKKPQFSQFNPKHLATISSGSTFDFIASANTIPDSIEVKIKNQPLAIQVNKESNHYRIRGKLPTDLKTSYARIAIQAFAAKKCRGNGGWLVNISEE